MSLQAYFESINHELTGCKDRIRNIIGDQHWPSDGQHKEWLVKNILRRHAPRRVSIGNGFIIAPSSWNREKYCTHQIDLLIISSSKPLLFCEDDFYIVTPDAVLALIEVKTRLDKKKLSEELKKKADDLGGINASFVGLHPKAGLFIYENTESIKDDDVLEMLQMASEGNELKVINWIALGEDRFFQFWEDGKIDATDSVKGAVWYSYELKKMSHPYFLSNIIWAITKHEDRLFGEVWFPIDMSREAFRRHYMSLDGKSHGVFK